MHRLKGLHTQEEVYGQTPVTTHWADNAEAVSEAVDLCSVDCINYVPKEQFALLEHVGKGCKRQHATKLESRLCTLKSGTETTRQPEKYEI